MSNMPLDPRSNEWQELRRWLEGELQDTYRQMCRLQATNDETQQMKGRAAYISKLLGLGTPPAGVPAEAN